MKEKDPIVSRREFFKKAAKTIVPILGVMTFGPTLLNSCGDDDDAGGCSNCRGNCSITCGNSCRGNAARASSCRSGCTSLCISSCRGYCYTSSKDNG